MSNTVGRRGRKLDKNTSTDVMKKVRVDIPDLGEGCPYGEEGHWASHVVAWNKLSSLMAKMQPNIQKLIKVQTKDILESLDPANIGKSREIKIPNPSFNPKESRTDTDEEPCIGDNAFWMTSYESIYDRDRFRPNVIEDLKKMYLGANKEIVKQYTEALQDVYKLREELENKKEEMETSQEVKDDADDIGISLSAH